MEGLGELGVSIIGTRWGVYELCECDFVQPSGGAENCPLHSTSESSIAAMVAV